MEKSKKETKPFAVPSPPIAASVERADEDSPAGCCSFGRRRRRRRCLLRSFLHCAALVAVAGVIILVLSFTVFKVKDPTLTMNSLIIERIDLDFGGDARPRLAFPLSINATLDADISIENPNSASFRFRNSTTDFYYGGETVGVAYAPAGRVAAHRSVRMRVRVDVLVDRVAMQLNLTLGLLTGSELILASRTQILGRVGVLGVYKRDIEMTLNCSIGMEVSIAEQKITTTDCIAIVK